MDTIDLDTRRIQALTDATFAVAMTILVLDIEITPGLNHSELISSVFNNILPTLFTYFLSFIILGAFWIDTHYHHQLIIKTDRKSSWLNIISLMFICIIPFSSRFLIKYGNDPLSALFYCLNLLAVTLCHLFMLMHAYKSQFTKDHITRKIYIKMCLRILIPIVIYCIIIPLTFFLSKWIKLLFLAPLTFQILFGRFSKEIKPE